MKRELQRVPRKVTSCAWLVPKLLHTVWTVWKDKFFSRDLQKFIVHKYRQLCFDDSQFVHRSFTEHSQFTHMSKITADCLLCEYSDRRIPRNHIVSDELNKQINNWQIGKMSSQGPSLSTCPFYIQVAWNMSEPYDGTRDTSIGNKLEAQERRWNAEPGE